MKHVETADDTLEKYSKKARSFALNPVNMSRMNDPSGSAWIQGLCGDTIEIYLVIEKNIITKASFYTDGCAATLACGSAVTELATGRSVDEILSLSPKQIIDYLDGLPAENIHCTILAVSTLHKAVADYLLKY